MPKAKTVRVELPKAKLLKLTATASPFPPPPLSGTKSQKGSILCAGNAAMQNGRGCDPF
jgi:hypothetical protein